MTHCKNPIILVTIIYKLPFSTHNANIHMVQFCFQYISYIFKQTHQSIETFFSHLVKNVLLLF
jgi:hypothetical protein